MPGQARIGDKATTKADNHGCPNCPHGVNGPATAGSWDVFINRLGAVRQGDAGRHVGCCGPNTWQATGGSASVFINRKPAFRKGDAVLHCGGPGRQAEGSDDVIIGG